MRPGRGIEESEIHVFSERPKKKKCVSIEQNRGKGTR